MIGSTDEMLRVLLKSNNKRPASADPKLDGSEQDPQMGLKGPDMDDVLKNCFQPQGHEFSPLD